jgi:non-specific serine/threonine protein kinase
MRGEPGIGTEFGNYRLAELLSRGGMGVVYLAEDERMGRTVALKLIAAEYAQNDAFRARFLHESRVAGAINHPNVIPVYDAGEHDGLLYIAMRYVEGTDLRGLLDSDAPLEIERTVSIVSQAAAALAETHARGLIHRDVKPANILLVPRRTEDGTDHVYLSDFGLAKHLGSLSGPTRTGQFMGTVGYVAPEQIRGKGVERRTDVYALGCVLFECLTGAPPFPRKDDFATIMAHVNDPPPRVSELRPDAPAAIEAVVQRALAKAPEDRFDDCDEMGIALRRAVGRSGATPVPASAPAPAREADQAASRGSVWFDADVEKASSAPASAAPAAFGETVAGSLPDGPPLDPAGESTPPPSPAAPPAARASKGLRSIPRGVLALLGAIAVCGVVALALVLIGGGDGTDQESAKPPPTRVAPDTAPSDWRAAGLAPTARQQVATAVLGGRIWIAGGLGGQQKAFATNLVESYDPAIKSWSTAPSLPRGLHHAAAVAYRGELIVIGGWEPRGPDLTAVTSGEVMALRKGRWVRLAPLHHPRAAAAAAVVDDKIVVFGGQADGGKLVKQTEYLPGGVKWHDGADLPTPREHLAGASDGRYVYAVGGRKGSADKNTRALERYDARTDRWTKLPSMPVASGSLGAAILKGRLIAVGGEDATRVLDVVQSYRLNSRRWSRLDPLPTPRHGLAVAALGDTLYAIDGALAGGHLQSTNKIEALDIK